METTVWVVLALIAQALGLVLVLRNDFRTAMNNAVNLEHRLTQIETRLEHIEHNGAPHAE